MACFMEENKDKHSEPSVSFSEFSDVLVTLV